jgi:hypothetical protein
VFEPERLPPGHPLVGIPTAALTPHVAFYSEESIAELQRQATLNVVVVLEGRETGDIVNRAAIPPGERTQAPLSTLLTGLCESTYSRDSYFAVRALCGDQWL